jgi:hypothetical protein
MAFIFQSNPNQWRGMSQTKVGSTIHWYVTRYRNLMGKGNVVLFWEAAGAGPPSAAGLYGWGITTGEVYRDGDDWKIPVLFIEKWVREGSSTAPISRAEALGLPSWQDHLLKRFPAGTNFVVSVQQVQDLIRSYVQKRYPESSLSNALALSSQAPLEAAGLGEPKVLTWHDGGGSG